MRPSSWLYLEPYYGGSHRALADALARDLPMEFVLWTLPARKWKWRMRAAALHFADRFAAEEPQVEGIFTSSMLNAAELRGLLPPAARALPLVLYFHENQLVYPVQVDDERDFHFGWSNALSAASAGLVLWNSAFNRDSFLGELERLIALMPDARPTGLVQRIRERSQVLPVPVAVRELMAASAAVTGGCRSGPCRILWNHRWEHDKGPDVFFEALLALATDGLDFEVAVLGQSFADRPAVFGRAQAALGARVAAWGFVKDRAAYIAQLAACDVAVSTASHEFQGLAVLEAAACGAVPLVPDGLAYREIWPPAYRYAKGELRRALRERILEVERWRAERPQDHTLPFDRDRLLPRWAEIFGLAI